MISSLPKIKCFPYFCPPEKGPQPWPKNQIEETIVDVQEVYTKTEVFVDRNRKALTIGLAVVALVVISFFAYQNCW